MKKLETLAELYIRICPAFRADNDYSEDDAQEIVQSMAERLRTILGDEAYISIEEDYVFFCPACDEWLADHEVICPECGVELE